MEHPASGGHLSEGLDPSYFMRQKVVCTHAHNIHTGFIKSPYCADNGSIADRTKNGESFCPAGEC